MISLFHGDHLIASRQALNQAIKDFKHSHQAEIIRLEAQNLTEDQLTQALESGSLFGQDKLIIIENLFSLPQSQLKTKLIQILLKNQAVDVLLWEKKSLTPANQKKLASLKNFRLKQFKTPAIIFKFLDSLKPQNTTVIIQLLHQAVDKDSAELVFYLLARRLSQLIQALDDPVSLKGAPWQIGRLKSQAKDFHLTQLLQLHQQLLDLDYRLKTGRTAFDLATELDLLLAGL